MPHVIHHPPIHGIASKRELIDAVMRLAGGRNGIVRHDQLVALGATPAWIRHQIELGWLRPIQRGLYLVGADELSLAARFTAAADAGGPGAMLLDRTGAVAWGMLHRRHLPDRLEVGTFTHRRSTENYRMRRLSWLRPEDRRTWNGAAIASRAVTIISAARAVPVEYLITMLDHADFRDRTVVRDIERLIERRTSIPDLAKIRDAIARFRGGETGVASGYEFDVDRELDRIGASPALLNPVLLLPDSSTIKVDRYWPRARFVLEADGPPHGRERQQAIDPDRDERLAGAGIETRRLPWTWDPTAKRRFLDDVARRVTEPRSGPEIVVIRRG